MKRILLVLAVVLIGSLGVVTAATAAGQQAMESVSRASHPEPAPPPVVAPVATISYSPASGSNSTNPTAEATATVREGKFDEVTLTGPKGKHVKGSFNSEHTEWTTTGSLAYGTTYTWGGSAVGTDGKSEPVHGSFSTLSPAKIVRGILNIGDGRTVGVAAPVRIQFNAHVADRAAVERALSVSTSVPVAGSWGWLPDEGGGSRVDWRPKEYWPSGTTVTVKAKLFGVAYGQGAYGATNITSTFEIGRKQVVEADVNSHRMIVIREGKQIADFPASYGLGSDPNRNTRSGIHVVTEKFTDKRMVSEQYGYDTVEKWAVRISNNGEFIHANPASAAAQGSDNVTHGCVNLSIDDAKSYYDTAIYGDPVEVTGTPIQLSARDGDIWDWTLSWNEWKKLSAL